MGRLRDQEGFGLVELLIAMTILAVGLMAMIAAFASASFGVNRGTRVQTATSIADSQIETFKMLIFDHVGTDTSSAVLSALDATYKNDTACYDSATATYCTNTIEVDKSIWFQGPMIANEEKFNGPFTMNAWSSPSTGPSGSPGETPQGTYASQATNFSG
jgi:prepilin-type N-terminal cleavage/methylation domain-containing protein